MWDVKEPTHYSKRAGHEVPGVVAVLCECMGGYREGDMHRMGLSDPLAYHLALRCKSCKNKNKNMLLSTTQFGFGTAYQLVHDFPILYCCSYSPFVEMLYKQFKVLEYV